MQEILSKDPESEIEVENKIDGSDDKVGALPGGGRPGLGALIADRSGIGQKQNSAASRTSEVRPPSVTVQDLGLAPKPKIVPGKKMKSLFWSKVKPKSLAGTVFMAMAENDKIDLGELENDFFDPSKEKQKNSGAESGEKKAIAEKPKEIILISPKRNQNVSIALARYKCSNAEFRQKIITFDSDFINVDNLGKLMIMIPDDEEIQMVRDYEGDPNLLGKVAQWMMEMIKIPRLKIRLECCSTMMHFEEQLSDLQERVGKFARAAEDVKKSKSFLSVLEIVMTVGNHMNGSSTRGEAHGFKLDALGKLTTIKANDRKKGTLMNFIVKQISTHKKMLLNFPEEFSSVVECSTIDMKQMDTDNNQMMNSMKKLRTEYDRIEKEMGDGGGVGGGGDGDGEEEDGDGGVVDADRIEAMQLFLRKCEPFLLRGEGKVEQFKQTFDGVKTDIGANLVMFGDEMKNWNSEKASTFYRHISDFVKAFNKAKGENEHILENAEREVRREKEKKERLAAGGAAGNEGGAPKDLFSAFKASQQGNTNDIVNEMQMRLAKRRAKQAEEGGGGLAALP